MSGFIPEHLPGPFLIIGEGPQDKALLDKLLQHHGIVGFQTGYAGGKDAYETVLGGLKVHRDFTNLRTIVLLADNDESPLAAFDNVQRQIIGAGGYGVPGRALEVARSTTNIVVVMLPWESKEGCLETLCLDPALDSHPEIKECITQFSACLNMDAWNITRRSKALLACTLATACASDPNTGLRYAWNRNENLIPLDHQSFNQLIDFLQRLSVST